MANTREILSRMKSIRDTMKIISAMYMISSTKLRKAKASLEETEPYFFTLQSMIGRILCHLPDIENKYFDIRKKESPNELVLQPSPPTLGEHRPVVEMLETGIKVIDLLAPYAKGGKIGLFGGAGYCENISFAAVFLLYLSHNTENGRVNKTIVCKTGIAIFSNL